MQSNFFQICLLTIALCLAVKSEALAQVYIDQNEPGITPEIFAPGLISKPNRYEFGSVFSKDCDEFYFGINIDNRSEILGVKKINGQWGEPQTIVSHPRFGFNDPFLSPDEDRLYYISNLTAGQYDESIDHDIWYSERVGDAWSEPINAGPEINSDFNEYYMSFSNTGNMFFSSNKENSPDRNHDFDIYTSDYKSGAFQAAKKLSDSINTNNYEADVFVAPDESYVIFVSFRQEGKGQGDLYISFKKENGSWTKAQNIGAPINTDKHELCPFVTHDGKYLFYTSNEDIYWVSTKLFEGLR